MHNLYLIGSSFIGIIILINYFARTTQNNTEIQNLDESELSDKNSNEEDALNGTTIILDDNLKAYSEIPKNKFLYPDPDEEYGIIADKDYPNNLDINKFRPQPFDAN